jgi:mannose-6-phosphate isomerase-like protein (cupin superfamily)
MTVTPQRDVEFVDLPGRRAGDPLRSVPAASSLRITRLYRTADRRAHRHPRSEEVIYVRSGTGAVYIDGMFHQLGPGDTVHVPQGAAHATIPEPGADMELVCFFPHANLRENIEETDIDVMKEFEHE